RDARPHHLLRLPPTALGVILRTLLRNPVGADPRRVAVARHSSQLFVDDDGIGFATGDGYATGSGLGLNLCRRIAAGYGGSLELAARPAGGTRATLRLAGMP